MNFKLLIAAGAIVCVAACAKTGPTGDAAPRSLTSLKPVQQVSTNSSSLTGKWSAEVELPASSSNDPAEQMAAEMAKAFAGSMWLELRDDGTFTLSMFIPLEGNWMRSGNKLSLTPTKFMGMSEAELKKQSSEAGGELKLSFESEPMVLDISADGKSLSLKSDDPSEGNLVFRRQS